MHPLQVPRPVGEIQHQRMQRFLLPKGLWQEQL